MKKYIVIAIAACVALAACTKNEVRPVSTDQEITFKTVGTKAAEAYGPSNTFKTWAYLHNDAYATGITNQLYLGGTNGLEISYVSKMINGRAAGIHFDLSRLMWNKLVNFSCKRIIKLHIFLL